MKILINGLNMFSYSYRWLVDDVNDFTSKDAIAFPLTKLEPYTQYAFYIMAYTLATEKTGAQSNIEYFRTLPGQPSAVLKLRAVAKNSTSVVSVAALSVSVTICNF
jgi:insulin receptor